MGKVKKRWERTNVTNLLRNGRSGTYYARVKVNGKEKWRSLKTSVFSVAKLKVGDVEKEEFVAPNAKATRKGMSASAFNKCGDRIRNWPSSARGKPESWRRVAAVP